MKKNVKEKRYLPHPVLHILTSCIEVQLAGYTEEKKKINLKQLYVVLCTPISANLNAFTVK